jgi:sugar phosphate isomerase/epimerase
MLLVKRFTKTFYKTNNKGGDVNMRNVVIPLNALDRNEVREKGQRFFIQKMYGTGVSGVEIRRELLTVHDHPLGHLKTIADEMGMFLVYSSPSPLWVANGRLNEELRLVIQEAKELGAVMLKVPLGCYDPLLCEMDDLKTLLEEIKEQLQLFIENDQTPNGGTISSLYRFFNDIHEYQLPVYMTFDIGNWKYCGESAAVALSHFHPFIRYVHLKHVEKYDGGLKTVPLTEENSKEWKAILRAFSTDLPIALEFPINDVEFIPYYIRLLQAP